MVDLARAIVMVCFIVVLGFLAWGIIWCAMTAIYRLFNRKRMKDEHRSFWETWND